VLDLMRRHARSWLIKAALGGIIIVFVFWYGWSGPVDESSSSVAEVNGTIISYDYFYSVYYSELEKLKLRFRGAMPEGLLEKLNLKQKIVKGLVNQLLLLQEAQRIGLFVTDEDLVQDIRSNPQFQRNGVFDDYVYQDYLRQIKLNPASYEQFRRQELIEEQLARLLTDGVKTDPGEIKKLWHFQNDKLILSMVLIKPQEENQTKAPDPKALEAYFKKNEKKFEIPPSVDLKFVTVSWRDLLKDVSVSDDDAKRYYQSHVKEFTEPEKIRARHILLKIPKKADKQEVEVVKKKIEEILAKIKGGEDFEKVAAERSQDDATAKKGGDLGFFTRGMMSPELEKVAFELKPGGISEPVLTGQGYHLIRVDEKVPEKQSEFQAVKDQIVKKLKEREARRRVVDLAENFYEKVYRTENLDGPAKEFGFRVKKGQSITKGGGIPEAGNDPKLMDQAFRLKTDEISDLVRSGENFVIMKLAEKIPARIPKLDDVRSAVVRDYQKQQAGMEARKKAEQLIQALKKEPGDPEKVAKQFGLTWQKLDPLSRTTGLVPQLGNSPELTEMLTTISAAAPLFPTPIPVADGVAVVRLSDLERASEQRYAKEAQEFRKWIDEVRKTEFLKGWLRVLEDRSKVTINEKLL
jgi:peptidyl-prolyl cis-trans isomerase D